MVYDPSNPDQRTARLKQHLLRADLEYFFDHPDAQYRIRRFFPQEASVAEPCIVVVRPDLRPDRIGVIRHYVSLSLAA
jgi:hypothetical protein